MYSKSYITYTGGYEYYIGILPGSNAVYRQPDGISADEPERVFFGTYTECLGYINRVLAMNYEYDNDL